MKELPVVKVGQVWKDNDKRMTARHLRVESIPEDPTAKDAKCTLVPCRPNGSAITIRTVKILIRRMRPTSTGYTLIKDVD
jgi:hypothetical protein